MAGDRPQFRIDGHTVIVAFASAALHVLTLPQIAASGLKIPGDWTAVDSEQRPAQNKAERAYLASLFANPSSGSVTAKPFYIRRGFRVVQEGAFGEEPTIVMSKDIWQPSK